MLSLALSGICLFVVYLLFIDSVLGAGFEGGVEEEIGSPKTLDVMMPLVLYKTKFVFPEIW